MITSLSNARIKNVLTLDKAHERRRQTLFTIEGGRELSLAVAGGYGIEEVFACTELMNAGTRAVVERMGCRVEEISSAVFEKMAYRGSSDGVVALARPRQTALENIRLSECPFVIVLEAVEKPGNLGAILRTADAAKVDAVVVCDPQTDVHNPNVVRSSVGCLFTVQVAACTSSEALLWMRQAGMQICAAELTASDWYHMVDWKQPSAVLMGTEADGLTDFWLHNADRRIKIPMRGCIDSLNVSVSTAIITFEAMRQRDFGNA